MHSYFLTITRSIRTNISKLFSIVVIMLLGIAFVSGLGTISPMIQTSFGNELRRENAPDLILKSSSDTGFQDEDGDGILDIVDDLLLDEICRARVDYDILNKVQYHLDVSRRHIERKAYSGRYALEIPYVRYAPQSPRYQPAYS